MQPHLVGVVTALVGFTSSFAVVLAGLRAVGADARAAASGLVVLCAVQGVVTIVLSQRHRIPLTSAWSTPGAALLVATGAVSGGWPAAVGAFLVCGVLLVVTALWRPLGRLVAAIPAPLAQAMLAGVLLTLCLAPVQALVATPLLVAPVVLLWLVLLRVAPRWAAPAAFALALVVAVVVATTDGRPPALVAPLLDLTAPTFTPAALVGIAVPLYLVTMASQNVPGAAVVASAGYAVPWREALLLTGIGTMAGAPAGGHAVNLAAITAALPASPDADPDPARRWLASRTAGVCYLVLAALAPTLTALVDAAPAGLVEAVAGLALLPALGSALAVAVADAERRIPALVTFLLAASSVTIAGIGAAFWGLVAGLVAWWWLAPRRATAPVPDRPLARE
ncbi:benzoate/H(+) symporter BenE family transporter [Cellulomonas sp. S1-8]|uniref:benzoate/H(+) symporter BenE family transporter n=1 Tax=Cellulomonas sp. S1-8 TaxID=2904790 RepID=UPI0022446536|nr:benzoate/H(+) symporter BenE family transporter [Cellulomonas sp. S1-8]UZN05405.1 benzoate/H(+) symporter BenE family transporter [Cellulomonas sp. S1-8]